MGKLVEAVDLPMEEVSSDIRGMLRAYAKYRQNMLSDIQVRNIKNKIVGTAQSLRLLEVELQEAQEPYLSKMNELEKGIQHTGIEDFTQSFQHAGTIVRFRKGSQRVSWKGTILNKLLEELQEEGEFSMAERVLTARNITPIAPTIKIEK